MAMTVFVMSHSSGVDCEEQSEETMFDIYHAAPDLHGSLAGAKQAAQADYDAFRSEDGEPTATLSWREICNSVWQADTDYQEVVYRITAVRIKN